MFTLIGDKNDIQIYRSTPCFRKGFKNTGFSEKGHLICTLASQSSATEDFKDFNKGCKVDEFSLVKQYHWLKLDEVLEKVTDLLMHELE